MYVGPETLLRQSSLNVNIQTAGNLEVDSGDVIEGHEWKCVRTVNGFAFFSYLLIKQILVFFLHLTCLSIIMTPTSSLNNHCWCENYENLIRFFSTQNILINVEFSVNDLELVLGM